MDERRTDETGAGRSGSEERRSSAAPPDASAPGSPRETDSGVRGVTGGVHGEAPTRLRLGISLFLGLGGAILMALLLFPFLPALVISAVLATLFFPAHRQVRRVLGQRDLAALLSTTVVFFLVLVPAILLSVVLIDNIRQGVEWLTGVVEAATEPGGLVTRAAEAAQSYLGWETDDLTAQATDEVSRLLGLLARRTFTFLSGLGGWLLQGAAALFSLFYFLRDGDSFVRTAKWFIPLDAETTDRLVGRTRDVIFATVWGNVAVAIVQGTLGGLAFFILGLPAAALWGSIMGVLSLLPVVGPMMVWLPAGIILLAQGEILRGILLLVMGAAIVSNIDNYLRAVIIGERAEMHSLVVFFSVLAGLFAFGAVGIFVGPVAFVIAFSLMELARATLDAAEGTPVQFPASVGPRRSSLTGRGLFRGSVPPGKQSAGKQPPGRRSRRRGSAPTGSEAGASPDPPPEAGS